MRHLLWYRIPEFPLRIPPVLPRPLGTRPKAPERGDRMSRKRKQNGPTPRPGPVTLADVLAALEGEGKLTATRRRDLVSGVKRVAILLGDEPAAIALDMPVISARLAAVNPVAV